MAQARDQEILKIGGREVDFTLSTMPARFARIGDPHEGIDEAPCSLDSVLALSARLEREGAGDAPWPPHYRKQTDEPSRAQPSRRRPKQETPGPDSGPV